MKKIIVIGSGGAGKSTVANRLGNALNMEVIHLDQIYWKPNWVKTPKDEWPRIVEQLLMREAWVMDGNFGGTREMRMRACDTVIFLDIPRHVCLYRILKRLVIYRGKSRPDMTQGCDERFDWDFIKWIWNYPYQARLRILDQLERFRDKTIIVLRTSREVDDFFLYGLR